MSQCREVFISYAHEDAAWRDEFTRMLTPACAGGLIRVWSDECIAVGENWSRSIAEALARAKVGLLLVSEHFLSSAFVTRVELDTLLNAARAGGVSVHWVPISPSLYGVTPLRDLQACCDPEKPLDELPEAERRAMIKRICLDIVEELGAEPKVSVGRREAVRQRVQERLDGKYVLGEVVGSGKYSLVYRAQRTSSNQPVGVKVFVASELDEWARGLFVQGVERASRLGAPVFIKIYDDFLKDQPEFLVTEFVEGKPLSRVLQSYPHGLPLDRVKAILLELARGIEEAHAQGFQRGEMRPSDILVERSGDPRLSPFDFTNVLREEAQMTSNFLLDRESLAYMAPERYLGHELTDRTDQYSLGLIATELLGGARIPPVAKPCDLEGKRALFEALEAGQGSWGERSAQFKGLVCRMLCIEPEGRWPSMRMVRDVLSEIDVAETAEEVRRAMAKASYLRIQGEPRFFERFYDHLFSMLPEVRGHFASVDMKRQYHVLNDAIHVLLAFHRGSGADQALLESLATTHATFGLTERHYRTFLEALVTTLGEFGEAAPALAHAWRSSLEPGLDFMATCQERGAQPPPAPTAQAANP
jgi:hemoglobin-like flavoprotein